MKAKNSKVKPNKLFSLLSFIDENELYRLKRYVHSDYFNTNNRLKQLFDEIWDARHEYASFENIDSEVVYKTVFPNKGISALPDDFSSLLKLVKGFLAQEHYNDDDNAKTRYYVKSLSSKKAHKQLKLEFNRERKKYKQSGKKNQLQSTENYYHNWYMAKEKVTYSIIHGSTKVNISDFNDVDQNLNRLYALAKSTSMASLELSASLRGINYETSHKDLLPGILEKIPIEECPLVFRYFESKKLYLENSHEQFLRCKTIFDQYVDRFDLGEQVQYCQMMYNVATMNQFNPDDIKWEAYQNQFAIYLFKIEIPYFKSINKSKFIRPSTFLNYINALIKTQKFKEAENKIKSHTKSVMYGDINLELCYNNYLQVALQLGKYLQAKAEKTKNPIFSWTEQASYWINLRNESPWEKSPFKHRFSDYCLK